MKNIIISLFIVCICNTLQGQKIKSDIVPESVKTAFKAKYPKATEVEWEKEDSLHYEAEFKMENAEYSALFDVHGQWVETEKEIKKAELPQAVQDAIKATFPGYKIDEAEQVEKPDGSTTYEVELEKGKDEIEAVFSADGKLISKETEKKDSEED